jgi:2-oxoglutarate ferredoxin oxidoreductase subunit gamma
MTDMQQEFLFAGFGGQGVMFAGQLLAYAGMAEGLNVTWIPSYGPEMRGGTAHCFVTLSDKQIGSPVVHDPKTGIVFNNPSFDKYEPQVAKGGLLVVNASLIVNESERRDIERLYIPATEIADQLGEIRLANVVILGATLTENPILPLEAVRRALDEHIPAHHRHLLEANYKALEFGAASARNAAPV